MTKAKAKAKAKVLPKKKAGAISTASVKSEPGMKELLEILLKNQKESSGDSNLSKRRKFIDPPDAVEDLKSSWRSYSRDIQEWRAQDYEEAVLAQSWLRKLTQSQRDLVHGTLDPPITSVEEIYQVLKTTYGTDEQLQNRSDEIAYRSHRRGTESIRDFMTQHTILRHRAMSGDMASDEAKGGFTLLEQANVSTSQKEQILRSIKTTAMLRREAKIKGAPSEGEAPSYSEVCGELNLLTQVYELEENNSSKAAKTVLIGHAAAKKVKRGLTKAKRFTKVKAELKKTQAALTAIANSGTAAPAKTFDWICPKCKASVFGSRGTCYKCDEPKPANPSRAPDRKGGKGGKGKGGGKSGGGKGSGSKTLICKYFEKGETCPYGTNCRFSHVKPE